MKLETVNQILGITESYKASDVMMKAMFDKDERERMFIEFLEHESQLDHDIFHEYFQDEHAERKKHKQDFTPQSISNLLAKLVTPDNGEGTTLDVAAGTGGITIAKWQNDRIQVSPFEYKPSNYFYQCEELSDRAIPFLLFNLLIRGMNATVLHGDSITRQVKQIYFIQNETDDFMSFSSLNVMPHSKMAAKEFNVKEWTEEAIEHIESEKIPEHLKGTVRERLRDNSIEGVLVDE